MSNYVKATNFTAKDSLLTGNPAKIIKGAEIDDEFNLISTAIATKPDSNSPTFTGVPLAPTATAGTNTTQIATTAFVTNVTSTLGTMSTQNKTAVDITGGTIIGVNFTGTINSLTEATTQTSGNNSTKVATTAYVDSAVSIGVPSGAVMPFARNTAPTGWLKANGSAVSRTTYASLFSAIGVTFGGGDGSTTFNVPDLRGEFARGWDDGRGVDSGRAFGSAQAATFIANLTGDSETVYISNPDSTQARANIRGGGGSADAVRSAADLSVRPRNIALLYCIKI